MKGTPIILLQTYKDDPRHDDNSRYIIPVQIRATERYLRNKTEDIKILTNGTEKISA